MSYRVLARKYRSHTFDELVGQDAIATTLKNAIISGRIHHGYLFTGTRGVGKTSAARILAKSLNCLAGDAPTITPCGRCDSCVAVSEGEDLDVVEIDAASNTGVDNIRDLRSGALLRPARARFKVYIIDEVHMLSTGAFNALLKTLEEPPPHVKFILATTELHKVPATIISRCQRFDFRSIDSATIAEHLRKVLRLEQIEADDVVVRRIARLANGSMRDALSLLDKLLSYESKHLTAAIVEELLPPAHDELAAAVFEAIGGRQPAEAIRALDRALEGGQTIDRFCDQLIQHIRTLMLMRVCGPETDLVDVSESRREPLRVQSECFDAPTYVYMISLLEELRRQVRYSGAARALADAAMVRLAMSHQFSELRDLLNQVPREAPTSPPRPAPTPSAARSVEGNPAPARPPAARAAEGHPTPARPTSTRPDAGPALFSGIRPETSAKPPQYEPAGGEVERNPAQSVERPAARTATGRPLTSAEMQRVRQDPLVERVRQAVDGTLTYVRRVSEPQPEPARVDEASATADHDQPGTVE